LHPLAKQNPTLMIVDGFIHGVIEGNPRESVMKFVRYNLFKVVEAYQKSGARKSQGNLSKAKRSA
jgi:hypothetical protein